MKKVLLLSGIVLMLLSVGLLVGVVHHPPSFTKSLLCPNGMTLDEETITRNSSRRNKTLACQNQAGEMVDVTERLLLIFLIPFAIGLSLLIFGSRRKTLTKASINHRLIVVNFKSER